jgi:hypothetical protein
MALAECAASHAGTALPREDIPFPYGWYICMNRKAKDEGGRMFGVKG